MQEHIPSPDKNRPSIYKNADVWNICVNSLEKIKMDDSDQARVMLIVPPQTKIQKSLTTVLNEIKNQLLPTIYPIEEYESLVQKLTDREIFYIEEQKRAGIPMGLLRIWTAANKWGYNVKIVDAAHEWWENEKKYFQTEEASNILRYGLSDTEILKDIEEYNPHIIGITSNYTHQWWNAKHLIELIKSYNKDIVVVMGWTHASSMAQDIIETTNTDYIVRGQADRTFVQLLDTLTTAKWVAIENISWITYRKNSISQETPDTKFMGSIDDIAIPNLDLINLDIYNSEYHSAGRRKLKNGKIAYGFTSIWCNSNCTFCCIPKVQWPWKNMGEQKFNEYLQYLKSFGITELLVEDDNLLTDPERALMAAQGLKEHNIARVEEGGISLYNLIALLEDTTEEELQNAKISPLVLAAKKKWITAEKLIKEMAESWCYSAYLAVETPNRAALDTSKKSVLNANHESTKKVIELFKKYQIKVACWLMFWFINVREDGKLYIESREEIRQTFEWAKEIKSIWADYINFFIVTPLPGSTTFQKLGDLVPQNTDEAFSHEFGNMDAPNNERTKNELTLLRVKWIVDTIWIDGYVQMIKTWTRPM
jgi:anaerobic magnesium-protoporphyrin IX monomethyl ester cyclase